MAVKLVHGYCMPLIWAAHSPLEIARLGGIQAHVTAIKEHPTHAVVQEEACGTLLTLAAGNDENRAQITGEGGVRSRSGARWPPQTPPKTPRSGGKCCWTG